MSTYRQLHTRMWSSDQWFADLRPEFKLLFIYLFSNERASVSGLYELPLRVMCFETGLEKDMILAGFEEFKKPDPAKVLYDPSKGVVYVLNMFKYQGSSSKWIKERIKTDLKSIPDCQLKTLWLQENRVLIGYGDGGDTSFSITSSSSSSISDSDSLEEEGMGGETIPIPETPRQAMVHPDMITFQQACGRIPGQRNYAIVIETIRFLRTKHGNDLVDFLKPYWTAWSTRKTKDGKPYSPNSIVWLCEWAMQGEIPSANGSEPKISGNKAQNQDVIRKVAQRATANR